MAAGAAAAAAAAALLTMGLLAGRAIGADVTGSPPLAPPRPHIIVIMADDLGWNDVSFHGSDQIPTPNIDALAFNGIILNSHYSLPLCTPSRAALMTGKYPIRTGMQHNVILEAEPWGLPLDEKLLPQHLRDLGYATHAVGKWHLGYYRHEYTPTFRGFDSHFGYWNGHQDYYSHVVQASFAPFEGYDMRRNMSVAANAAGRYSTRLFTEEAVRVIGAHDPRRPLFLYMAHLAPHAGNYETPLQAPADTLARFHHIQDPARRKYAAMVAELDASVGQVLQALQERGMLAHSTVLFLSDNGAPTRGIHANHGSNWPLKGVKATLWEGGVRVPACLWSASLRQPHRVSNHLLHITDWLPTFVSLAGGNVSALGQIDGIDMWKALTERSSSPRKEMLVNLDDVSAYAALRVGNMKYINVRGVRPRVAFAWLLRQWRRGAHSIAVAERTLRLVPRFLMRLVTRVPGPAGTTLLGFLDEWHGRPADAADPPYDPVAVLASPAGRALADAGAYHGAPSALDAQLVRLLRDAATLRCAGTDTRTPKCRPRKKPCVFDLGRDPCEERNLYTPEIGAMFESRLEELRTQAKPPRNRRGDRRADPTRWGGVWSPWADAVSE